MNGKKAVFALFVSALMAMMSLAVVAAQDQTDPGLPDNGTLPVSGDDSGDVGPGNNMTPTDPYMPYYYWPEVTGFELENGSAVGSYLSFNISADTGTVTDYTAKVTTFDDIYPLLVYEERTYVDPETGELWVEGNDSEIEPVTENITVFDSIEIDGFVPVSEPNTYRDSLVMMGDNLLMEFTDREWTQTHLVSGGQNNTIVFTVADGLTVEMYPYADIYRGGGVVYDDEYWNGTGQIMPPETGVTDSSVAYFPDNTEPGMMPPEVDNSTATGDSDVPYDDVTDPSDCYWCQPWWNEIWIESDNVVTSIYIEGGAVLVENQTVTVTLDENGYLDISTWSQRPFFPVMDDTWYAEPDYNGDIETVDEWRGQGLLAGEGWYYNERGDAYENSDFYSEYDPTFDMGFDDANGDRLDVIVDSDIPNGRIVSISIDSGRLDVSSIREMLVELDDSQIKAAGSLNELESYVGGSEAAYFAMIGDQGTTLFVYVPHFSTHTISVSKLVAPTSSSSNVLVPAVLGMALVSALALALFVRGRKAEKEE